MDMSSLAADILLAPYGLSHKDLPDAVTPEPQNTGEYELFNTTTEEVEAVMILTAARARKLNEELRAESDDRRWVPFCAEGI